MSSTQARERVLVAAGTKTYRYGAQFAEPLANLDMVPDALRWVVEALTGLGYTSAAAGARNYLLNPSVQRLKESIRSAAGSASVVVVYYTGHGLKPERSPYFLVTAGASPDRLGDTALKASDMLDLVLRLDAYGEAAAEDEQPEVLVILDCCFSGAGGIEALRQSLQDMGNPKVWVLASAGSLEYAQQGRFAAALKHALQDPDVGPSQRLLGLDWIAESVNAAVGGAAGQRARYFPPSSGSSGFPPFFPNPKFVPNVAGLTVTEQHWVSRLRGASADDAPTGFYVTGCAGRARVVADLANWMRDPARGDLAVVTGSPGSGKSAMLALPVLLAGHYRDPLVSHATEGSLLARAADLFDGLPVGGVHARGMNPYQAAVAVAGHLGRSAEGPEELLDDLQDNPELSPRIIVIDAVDEARDPRRMLTDLVLPLTHRPGVRVAIGARRHVVPSTADNGLFVDLDSDNYRDPQALAEFAHQVLIAANEPEVPTPYRNDDPDGVGTMVAAAIAQKATARPTATGQAESFVLAKLLALAVRGHQQLVDVKQAGWERQLPVDIGAAFDADLQRLGKREPIARTLLAALAWAKGPGLPWETIWPAVGRAVSAQAVSVPQLTNDHVRWLLESAGGYLVEDVGPGDRSVFRPFHDLLAAHLRGQPAEEQTISHAAADDWQQRRQQVERHITRALINTIPTFANGMPDWELAHPYVCAYIAQHAHAAGRETFADLAGDLDYLAVADPAILTPLLTPTDPELRWVARPYRRARPLLGANPHDNKAYLQEAVVTQTDVQPASEGLRPTYRTVMARVRRDDSLLTIVGHRSSAVACGADAQGRPLLASASKDGTVRLWDPTTGAGVGEPLQGHRGSVTAVAFGANAQGRPLLASADDEDGWVRVWDATTGAAVGDPLRGHIDAPSAVAFGSDGQGRPLLASAGNYDGTVRVWDPTTGAAVGDPLRGHTSPVSTVAFGSDGQGRPLLASAGSFDGTVRVCDPTTGAAVGSPWRAHTGPVGAVAFGSDGQGRPLLASAGNYDGTVRVWDPTTGAALSDPLRGHTGGVNAVAFGADALGRPLVASGADDCTVRLWDPTIGVAVGDPLWGHSGPVSAVAFGSDGQGRPLLVSRGADGTVRVWEAGPDPSGAPSLERLAGALSAVALSSDEHGRLLLASASGDDDAVRLWDPTTGAAVGDPLGGHIGPVSAVAFGSDGHGRPLLASAANRSRMTSHREGEGTVQVWDPTTGAAVGDPLRGHTGTVSAVAFGSDGQGRPLLVSAETYDATVRVWDPTTGAAVGDPLRGHTGGVYAVAFGSDGQGHPLLASAANDGTVRVWDPTTGAAVGDPLRGHTGTVSAVAFGLDGQGRPLLASGGDDGTLRLWDPTTGAAVGDPLRGHSGGVYAVAFGSDRQGRLLLASAANDATVRLWDPTTSATIAELRRRMPPRALAAHGNYLVIGDAESLVVLEVVGAADRGKDPAPKFAAS